MRNLPLRQLRAFAALHQAGGIRAAGRHLGIAHSAVSRHVTELEAWLDTPLLAKTGRSSFALTSQGEALGQLLSRSFEEMARAVEALREARRGNNVTISTTTSVASRWLLPLLPRLHDAAPWVEISVIADQRIRDPSQAGADIGIRMGQGPWPDLDCEPLMDDWLFPVVGRERWEADGCQSDLQYLAKLPLLHDRDPGSSWALWKAQFALPDLDIRAGSRFSSTDLVLHAAAQGLGVALARGRLAEGDLRAGLLVRPFGSAAVHLRDAYWIVRPTLHPNRAAHNLVLDWLKKAAAIESAELLHPTGFHGH